MTQDKNPFKVPDGYFEKLNADLLEKSLKKHVSGPKKFRWVAAVATAIVLILGAWLVIFQDTKLDLRRSDAFAFLVDGAAKTEQAAKEQMEAEALAWQKQKAEMQQQAEKVEFSEDELQLLEEYADEQENELLLTYTDVEL